MLGTQTKVRVTHEIQQYFCLYFPAFSLRSSSTGSHHARNLCARKCIGDRGVKPEVAIGEAKCSELAPSQLFGGRRGYGKPSSGIFIQLHWAASGIRYIGGHWQHTHGTLS